MKITDKNIKKEIVRNEIMTKYVELCMHTSSDFSNVLGVSLSKFSYSSILNMIVRMNDADKFTYVSQDEIEWYDKMIKTRNL